MNLNPLDIDDKTALAAAELKRLEGHLEWLQETIRSTEAAIDKHKAELKAEGGAE